MSNPQPNPEKKHRGLGRLLGKKDKSPQPTEQLRPDPLPDSAYGSSGANSADGVQGRNSAEIVHAEKNSEIANIDQDRNLALRPSTGEVFDEDTGEVVTVVTTTTTTTTRGGKKHQDVSKDVQREVQSAPGQPPLLEMPAGPPGPEPASQPAVTSTSTTEQAEQPPPMSGAMLQPDSPPIPPRSAMRRSGEVSRDLPIENGPVSPVDASFPGHTSTALPESPSRPNFSYPSRSSIKTADQPMRHNQSTIDDLKAAAKGIHVRCS